jgi:transcriptional regulator with XRE-family HTH domain
MDIGRRIRDVREDLGMPAAELARRVGVAPNTVWRYEAGEREPSMAMLEKIARALRTEPAELLREPSPLAAAPSRASRESVSASVRRASAMLEDTQRALLEVERLMETARPRVEESLARVKEASARIDEVSARVDEAYASYREQVARLQEVGRVMDEVYDTEMKLGWAYVKAMMEEGSPEGHRARRLRSASRKMVLFYEELVDLIRDAGVQVKRQDEGKAVEEPEAPVRPGVLELTVH